MQGQGMHVWGFTGKLKWKTCLTTWHLFLHGLGLQAPSLILHLLFAGVPSPLTCSIHPTRLQQRRESAGSPFTHSQLWSSPHPKGLGKGTLISTPAIMPPRSVHGNVSHAASALLSRTLSPTCSCCMQAVSWLPTLALSYSALGGEGRLESLRAGVQLADCCVMLAGAEAVRQCLAKALIAQFQRTTMHGDACLQ